MTTFWDRLKPTQITSWADQVEQEDLMTQDTLTVAEFATCVANLVNRCVLDPEAASSAFHFQMDDMYIDIMARSQLIISVSHVKYELPQEQEEEEEEEEESEVNEEIKTTKHDTIYVFNGECPIGLGKIVMCLTEPIYTCKSVKEAVRFARSHTPCHAYDPSSQIIYNFNVPQKKGYYRKVAATDGYRARVNAVVKALPGAQTPALSCPTNPFDVLANDETRDDT